MGDPAACCLHSRLPSLPPARCVRSRPCFARRACPWAPYLLALPTVAAAVMAERGRLAREMQHMADAAMKDHDVSGWFHQCCQGERGGTERGRLQCRTTT